MLKNLSCNEYRANVQDTLLNCDCSASAMKIFLPAGNGSIVVNKTDASANAITVLGERNKPLDGSVLQVEKATVVGTVSGAGNAAVVVTSADIDGSPITLNVPVLVNDTATIVASKISAALQDNRLIGNVNTGFFTVSSSGAVITLTKVYATANDSTLNVSIDNGTCTGLTTAASSANTTAGVAITVLTQNAFKTFENNGNGWIKADFGGVNETETLTNKTLTAPKFASGGYIADSSGNEQIKFTTTSSAVNEITVTNAATNNAPSIASTGSNTNIGLTIAGKGTGSVNLGQSTSTGVKLVADQPIIDSAGNELVKFVKATTAVNEITITNSATTVEPTISATGDDTNINIGITGKGTGGVNVGAKVKVTPEGGIAIKLTNKTGGASVKGTVVGAATGTDNAFILQAAEYESIGIVYESGIADAAECWVVVAGIAEILLKDTTASTRGQIVFAADTDGRAITGAVPTPPADDSHFKEIGHCIESKTQGTDVLFKAVIHFN